MPPERAAGADVSVAPGAGCAASVRSECPEWTEQGVDETRGGKGPGVRGRYRYFNVTLAVATFDVIRARSATKALTACVSDHQGPDGTSSSTCATTSSRCCRIRIAWPVSTARAVVSRGERVGLVPFPGASLAVDELLPGR